MSASGLRFAIQSGLLSLTGGLLMNASVPLESVVISEPVDDSFILRLAAREVRRYVYLRTGSVPELQRERPLNASGIVVLRSSDSRIDDLPTSDRARALALKPEEYLLRTVDTPRGRHVWIIGGDDVGALHGAYRFCERIGVRFYLHGDVVPDTRLAEALPVLDERAQPLFSLRGLLPFHDFPEGPDWWSRDAYLAHVSQLAKLRMNFLALHCYPESDAREDPEPHAEPLVWIGRKQDIDAAGRVSAGYPAFWAATQRTHYWGYDPMRTSEFSGGASELFPREDHAHEIFTGLPAQPQNPDETALVFNRAGELFADVFGFARSLGIKIGLGTETPLAVPQSLRAKLRAEGRDPAVVQELYTGMFERIKRAYPIDYYWLWTPESWTWSGNNQEQYDATLADITSARAALDAAGRPFTLATSGWVLGPMFDRTALDRWLPRDMPMSAINREVGHDLIEGGFRNVEDRPTWAIPWLENDQNLASPQLWVGRMRYDAVDARALGCTGLLGVHWRTQILAPNIAAFAAAGWDQSYRLNGWDLRARWAAGELHSGRVVTAKRPTGGRTIDENKACETLLEDCHDIYIMGVPDGRYSVTLLFNEPAHDAAGQRIFDVALQEQTLVRNLDVFARVGPNRVLPLRFEDFAVGNSPLRLQLTPRVGKPAIAGIGVEGLTQTGRKLSLWINLGGAAVGKFSADYTRDKPPAAIRARGMPVDDFYADFARANFGETVGDDIARLFASIDGMNLPQSSHWERGPGAINPLPLAADTFAFVDELARLRSSVVGAGNLFRFDYWLNTFRFQQALAEVGALRAELDSRVYSLGVVSTGQEKTARAEHALATRLELARAWEKMMSLLVSCTETSGELGTISNLEQHNRRRLKFLSLHDETLAAALGRALPTAIEPARKYSGPPRLVVPTVRSAARPGEALRLTLFAIGSSSLSEITLHQRRWGETDFHSTPARRLGRAVFEADLPPSDTDIDYYVSARTSDGNELRWPASAPQICQTVITLPQPTAN